MPFNIWGDKSHKILLFLHVKCHSGFYNKLDLLRHPVHRETGSIWNLAHKTSLKMGVALLQILLKEKKSWLACFVK